MLLDGLVIETGELDIGRSLVDEARVLISGATTAIFTPWDRR